MAESYKEYIGDGTTHQFAVPFPYIDKSHVHLYIDGVEDTTFTWITSGTIQATTIPAYGSLVIVRRETPSDERLVDFTDTSMLQEETLDRDSQQNFFNMQELADFDENKLAYDPLIPGYDAQSRRIVNVANPVNNNDAINKTYFESVYTPQLTALVAGARDAQDGAELAETGAMTAQGLAEDARDKAQKWAEETEDVPVETGKYSAKHWAKKAYDEKVTAGTYSGLAASYASDANDYKDNAFSYAQAAGLHRDKAQDWAEEAEDVPVETGKYSAKHWAAKAAYSVNNMSRANMGLGSEGGFGFRNKIIGGDFTTNPWLKGESLTNFGAIYTGETSASNWNHAIASNAQFTIEKYIDPITPSLGSYAIRSPYCMRITCTQADTTMGASDYVLVGQKIEGCNSASLNFGNGGEYATVSFWVRTNYPGTYCCSLRNGDYNKSYVFEFIATTSWTKVVHTLPTPSDGVWYTDNSIGIDFSICLASGTNFLTSSDETWLSAAKVGTFNQVNFAGAIGRWIEFNLIQIESGDVASEFDCRSVQQETLLAHRYFAKVQARVTEGMSFYFYFPTWMRTIPTVTRFTGWPASPTVDVITEYSYSGTLSVDVSESSLAEIAVNAEL